MKACALIAFTAALLLLSACVPKKTPADESRVSSSGESLASGETLQTSTADMDEAAVDYADRADEWGMSSTSRFAPGTTSGSTASSSAKSANSSPYDGVTSAATSKFGTTETNWYNDPAWGKLR